MCVGKVLHIYTLVFVFPNQSACTGTKKNEEAETGISVKAAMDANKNSKLAAQKSLANTKPTQNPAI